VVLQKSIQIKKVDERRLKIVANNETINFLRSIFKARPKNYYFNPKYKKILNNGFRSWDGYIQFIDNNGIFNKGLLINILKILKDNKINCNYDKNIILNDILFNDDEIRTCLKDKTLYEDTQIPIIKKILPFKNGLIKAPTGSGKSLIEVTLMNLYYRKGIENQILVVPRSTLVDQMYNHLIKSSIFIKSEDVGRLDGFNKDFDKKIIIATWQTLKNYLNVDFEFTKRFGLFILDEVHISSEDAKIVKNIVENFECKYKYGFSATISERNLIEYYNLISLFGPILAKDTVINQQNKNRIARCKIIIKKLNYGEKINIQKYSEYNDYIRYNTNRIQYIINLIREIREKDEKGNIILLTRNKNYSEEFYKNLNDNFKNVKLIYGETTVNERIENKNYIENNNGCLLIASEGCFGVGEDVSNLKYLILSQVRKSEIGVVQFVGRILRLHKDKEYGIIYHIVDNLKALKLTVNEYGEDIYINKNYAIKHMKESIDIYKDYGYKDYVIEEVNL